MILDKKISYFGNIWYQSGQSLPESSGVWRTLVDSPLDSAGLWQTLAGLHGPVKIIEGSLLFLNWSISHLGFCVTF